MVGRSADGLDEIGGALTELRIVLAAGRPGVRAFFDDMCLQDAGVRVTGLPLDSRAVAAASDVLGGATVGIVDASVDATEALKVFNEMRAQRPSLPIGVLFCCPHAAKAHRLRAFVAAGAGGFLDLRLSAGETLAALHGLAKGRGVFQLQLAEGSSTALAEALGDPGRTQLSDHDKGLLKLIMLGLTDCEIGRQLYLSPHTVKHRIERLRRRAQARNRVQLAAWAAHQDTGHTDEDRTSA
jgi:DNA-binding NarL/FixJ family response regulator